MKGCSLWTVAIVTLLQASFVAFLLMSTKEPTKKINFMSDLEKDYGYDGLLDKIRKNDMHQMGNATYLDYTGAGLYRSSQLKHIFETYDKNLFANPHSVSPASERSTEYVEEARDLVLEFLGAPKDQYSVIFTQSATASLRLLGESFPWSSESMYMATRDNHNSVLGIRGFAKKSGATFKSVEPSELEGNGKPYETTPQEPYNLFAYPAEENFAGRKYPLDWIHKFSKTDFGEKFNQGRWFTLLDAAAFVPNDHLDLKKYPADFVVMSFYKIFGYPNLGALVVRNDALKLLNRVGFSGGTVVIAGYGSDYVLYTPRQCAKFEDGTVPFLSIIALIESFRTYNELGIDRIRRHTWAVTRELFLRLNTIRHSNGRPIAKVYGNHLANDPSKQGPIVTVNFLHANGTFVGYNTVMKRLAAADINVRTGCFCNPGACTRAAGLVDAQVEAYFRKKTSCHDSIDIVEGVPLGAVRISPGMYTAMEDIEIFEQFVLNNFVE